MSEAILIGNRVEVYLNQKIWNAGSWFEGTVVGIEPYSQHRSFYWVELDEGLQKMAGVKLISVLNLKNIRKINPGNER